MNDGDWICPDANCGNINFSRRLVCYRCNKERPDGGKALKNKQGTEIGKSAAEKSRGLFNADDWQCNKCANVNWARRQTCNVCNAPKFGEVEARTGYGGGYNERGVVEYRRREPSSDDEYDEFGRKKRKRKADPPHENVGVTGGPVYKKVPPTVLPKEKKMEHCIRPAVKMAQQSNNDQDRKSGSLSDGSVCELAPLTKSNLMAFRKRQYKIPYYKQDYQNFSSSVNRTLQNRKRFCSIGEREHTASSGYETGSKRIPRNITALSGSRSGNPVMDNGVSSTNDDIYKFTGSNLQQNFQIIYTLEEKVQIASLAIVHKNCKITSDIFNDMYDKPAPDYQTIFDWSQRLLTTGCLVDNHVKLQKDIDKSSSISPSLNKCTEIVTKRKKFFQKPLPNPDEIPIESESDLEDDDALNHSNSIPSQCLLGKGSETLIIDNESSKHNKRPGNSVSPVDERSSQLGYHSELTHLPTQLKPDSVESNYPDSDTDKCETVKSKTVSHKSNSLKNSKKSRIDSDLDSTSGEETDYFTNYGKPKKKYKRRVTSAKNQICTEEAAHLKPVQRYCTAKVSEQSPLVTGNIYAPKLHMIPKKQQNARMLLNADVSSSEYIPTKIDSTAKKKYQEFKDNVKRGYWAKANGTAIGKPTEIKSASIVVDPKVNNLQTSFRGSKSYMPDKTTNRVQRVDFTKDDFDYRNTNCYTSFGKKTGNYRSSTNILDNSSRIFDFVQSDTIKKNKSIMDIFDNGIGASSSPKDKSLEKHDEKWKMYEKEYDVDEDDLYKNDDDINLSNPRLSTPSPPNIGAIQTHTPLSSLASGIHDVSSIKKSTIDFARERRDYLLELSKDFREKTEKEVYPIHTVDDNPSHRHTPSSQKDMHNSISQYIQEENDEVLNNISSDLPVSEERNSTRSVVGDNILQFLSINLPHTPQVSKYLQEINITQRGNDNSPSSHDANITSCLPSPLNHNTIQSENYKSPRSHIANITSCLPPPFNHNTIQNRNDKSPRSHIANITSCLPPPRNHNTIQSGNDKSPRSHIANITSSLLSPLNHNTVQSRNDKSSRCHLLNITSCLPPPFNHNSMQRGNDKSPRSYVANITSSLPPPHNQNTMQSRNDKSPGSYVVNIKSSLSHNQNSIQNGKDKSPTSSVANITNFIPLPYDQDVPAVQKGQDNLPVETSQGSQNVLESRNVQPSNKQSLDDTLNQNTSQNLESINLTPNELTTNHFLMSTKPAEIPSDLSEEIINISNERHTPISKEQLAASKEANTEEQSIENVNTQSTAINTGEKISTQTPQVDLNTLLSNINADTLLLAIQSLSRLSQNQSETSASQNEVIESVPETDENTATGQVETINLTNDEDWENESVYNEDSIEKQLEILNGNTGNTPFLGDIFDPGPVVIPPNVAQKLNLPINKPEADKPESNKNITNDNAPVTIGSFKSFALPKPILLNRLKKLNSSKSQDKNKKISRKIRKKKSKKPSEKSEGAEEEEEDEEESGDDADLSKYDLWGSEDEQPNSSKAGQDTSKEGQNSTEAPIDDNNEEEKNGSSSPQDKSKRRSSSSSSSSSTSSSSSSQSSTNAPKNKFDDFNLNSERESQHSSPGVSRKSRSRSPRSRAPTAVATTVPRRKSRDSRSAGESRSHDHPPRDKDYQRDRERRDRSRAERKERRYSRDGNNYYGARGKHR